MMAKGRVDFPFLGNWLDKSTMYQVSQEEGVFLYTTAI